MRSTCFFQLGIFFLSLFALKHFCHKATDGFTILKISSDLKFNPQWELTPLLFSEQEKIDQILDQNFFYLTKGGQCYVFESEDKTTVLKFFKQQHLRLFPLISYLPLDFCQRKAQKKQKELEACFNSYKIAFEELKEETGLLFVQLNKRKTPLLKKKVVLIDKLQIEHSIDLNQMEFALQRKASLVYPTFLKLLQQGEIKTAKGSITSLLELIHKRHRKGIQDQDANLTKNFGFCDGNAIQIDIGRFHKDEARPSHLKAEEFFYWLSEKNLELYDHFKKEYEKKD